MAIDLQNVQPNVISRDLGSRVILIYGREKIGKTTFASSAGNVLLLAGEKGYSEIPGVHAVDITRWSDVKTVLRQLRKAEVKELYNTVAVDTYAIFWDLAEKYIIAQHGVQTLGDIPWGGGWKELTAEVFNTFKEMTQLGYGIIFIAHQKKRVETVEGRGEIEFVEPNLNKRAMEVVNQMADIIGYATEIERDGVRKRVLLTRHPSNQILTGARNPHLDPIIDFDYKSVTKALGRAIEKQEAEGALVVDTIETIEKVEKTYEELIVEAKELWSAVMDKNSDNIKYLEVIVKRNFGRLIKLSETTPDQAEVLEVVVDEMKDLLGRLS